MHKADAVDLIRNICCFYLLPARGNDVLLCLADLICKSLDPIRIVVMFYDIRLGSTAGEATWVIWSLSLVGTRCMAFKLWQDAYAKDAASTCILKCTDGMSDREARHDKLSAITWLAA